MTNKRIRLPKEGLAPEGVREVGPGEARFLDETDVEGHGWTNPAPPIDFRQRTPTSGGEFEPTEDQAGTTRPDGAV